MCIIVLFWRHQRHSLIQANTAMHEWARRLNINIQLLADKLSLFQLFDPQSQWRMAIGLCVYIGTWHFEKLFLVADRKKGEIVCHLNKCCCCFFLVSRFDRNWCIKHIPNIHARLSYVRSVCGFLSKKYFNTQADLIVILNGIKSAPSWQTKVTLNQVNIDRPREEEKKMAKTAGSHETACCFFRLLWAFFTSSTRSFSFELLWSLTTTATNGFYLIKVNEEKTSRFHILIIIFITLVQRVFFLLRIYLI